MIYLKKWYFKDVIHVVNHGSIYQTTLMWLENIKKNETVNLL